MMKVSRAKVYVRSRRIMKDIMQAKSILEAASKRSSDLHPGTWAVVSPFLNKIEKKAGDLMKMSELKIRKKENSRIPSQRKADLDKV